MSNHISSPSVVPVIDLAREAERLKSDIKKTEDGREFLVGQLGTITWLTARREEPLYISAERNFHDGDSFARYVNSFKTGNTILIASLGNKRVKAFIDYHGKDEPAHVHHGATWQLTHSTEYNVWQALNGKMMSQAEFMAFLEENAAEIVSPEAATILELVSDFEQITTVTFKSSKRLHNGMRELVYVEKEGGGGIGRASLPEKITLRMPLFRGEEAVTFTAHIRYRITDGELRLAYEFHRITPVIEEAFNRAVSRVGDQVNIAPLYGDL